MSAKHIQSRDNPQYKSLLKLSNSARERRIHHQALLDGVHLIEAYGASGGRVESLIASESGLQRAEIAHLYDTTPADSKVVLADRLFQEIAAVVTPSGILALIATPVHEGLPKLDMNCMFLESIQDAGNVGSMLRTAAAAGIRHVFLSKGCAFAWSAKVLRAGMGAHFGLSLYEHVPLIEAAQRFEGRVIVTDLQASRSLYDADLSGPLAWVFGNEGAGVSAELAACAHLRVRIPMAAQTESLNVAAAAAVCLFEQARRNSE